MIKLIKAKYSGHSVVSKLELLIGTEGLSYFKEDIVNFEDYDATKTNVLVFDYSPIKQGKILIKVPNGVWEVLKMNSKIFNRLKKLVDYKEPHSSVKSNWLSSIRSSSVTEF